MREMGRYVLFSGVEQPLEWVEAVPPEPHGSEIRVRVRCCNLCRSDLHTHAGRRQEPLPLVLGHEIVGEVEAFGPLAAEMDAEGEPLEVGSRVTWAIGAPCESCFFCWDNLPQKCEHLFKYGHQRFEAERPGGGGLADQLLLARGTRIYRVPEGLPDAVAALANCAGATAAAVLRSAAEAMGGLEGRSVLVLGAGVLGVLAAAMARTAGATSVVVCDPQAAMRERALRFGATHVCEVEEVAATVEEATQGRGVDIALELAGAASSVESALVRVRIGGCVVLAGTVAPTPPVPLDPERLVRRMLTVRGVHNYHLDDLGVALRFLAGQRERFPFESLVTGQFPLSEVEAAFAEAHRQPGARIAVVPGEAS